MENRMEEYGEFIEEFEEEFMVHNKVKSGNKDKDKSGGEKSLVMKNSKPKTQEADGPKRKIIGIVVFIDSNEYAQKEIIGKIENFQNKVAKHKSRYGNYLFRPIDQRLPKMFIKSISQKIVNDLMSSKLKHDQTYFIAKFKDWPDDSYYPHVDVNDTLGKTGDIEVECDALLREYQVYTKDFTQETYDYLKRFKDYFNSNKE
jgi:exoribonuclease R